MPLPTSQSWNPIFVMLSHSQLLDFAALLQAFSWSLQTSYASYAVLC